MHGMSWLDNGAWDRQQPKPRPSPQLAEEALAISYTGNCVHDRGSNRVENCLPLMFRRVEPIKHATCTSLYIRSFKSQALNESKTDFPRTKLKNICANQLAPFGKHGWSTRHVIVLIGRSHGTDSSYHIVWHAMPIVEMGCVAHEVILRAHASRQSLGSSVYQTAGLRIRDLACKCIQTADSEHCKHRNLRQSSLSILVAVKDCKVALERHAASILGIRRGRRLWWHGPTNRLPNLLRDIREVDGDGGESRAPASCREEAGLLRPVLVLPLLWSST